MKKYSLLSLLLVFTFTTVKANKRPVYKSKRSVHVLDKLKFGLQGNHNIILKRDTGWVGRGDRDNIGIFREYKPVASFGIQTGLMYAINSLAIFIHKRERARGYYLGSLHSDSVGIALPVYVRFYPGAKKNLSLFLGPRLLFIFMKEDFPVPSPDPEEELLLSISLANQFSSTDAGGEIRKKNKFSASFAAGFNHEFDTGFMLGMHNVGLMLGYDFSKLLQ